MTWKEYILEVVSWWMVAFLPNEITVFVLTIEEKKKNLHETCIQSVINVDK